MKKYLQIEEYLNTQTIKSNNKHKFFLIIIFILCISIIIFSLYNIFNWQQDNSKIKELNQQIKKETTIKKKNEIGQIINSSISNSNDYFSYISIPFYEVDFTYLLEKNADTVAFIHMENTNINYPVVQANDNYYYLNHAYDKSENSAGWVFMDYRNNIDYLSDNTVIYGHGRLDNTVFGSLKNVLEPKWQEDNYNYIIWLSTKKENLVFQIFSIYTIKSESYYITTDFASAVSKQSWINNMRSRNTTPIKTEVSINDKILTLSTCLNNQGERIVVHAKLIKKLKRK